MLSLTVANPVQGSQVGIPLSGFQSETQQCCIPAKVSISSQIILKSKRELGKECFPVLLLWHLMYR